MPSVPAVEMSMREPINMGIDCFETNPFASVKLLCEQVQELKVREFALPRRSHSYYRGTSSQNLNIAPSLLWGAFSYSCLMLTMEVTLASSRSKRCSEVWVRLRAFVHRMLSSLYASSLVNLHMRVILKTLLRAQSLSMQM
jgi:hypothetical protein